MKPDASGLLSGYFNYSAALVLAAVRTDAMRQFLLVAIRAFRDAGFLQSVMGAAFSRARGGVSSFRIRHRSSLITQFSEGAPAVVRRGYRTIANRFVAVLAAQRADSQAAFAANALHRQQQKNLFPQDIL